MSDITYRKVVSAHSRLNRKHRMKKVPEKEEEGELAVMVNGSASNIVQFKTQDQSDQVQRHILSG